MVSASRPYFIALVSLFLSFQSSAAGYWPAHQVYRRQEPTSFSIIEQPSSVAENILAIIPTDINIGKNEKLEATASITEAFGEIPAVTSASQSSPPSAITSAMNGMPTSAAEYLPNSNDLPIVPKLTPGFAVAGTLMILSGTVYTVTGIRNKWLHIYLSGAYLASIGTTVLILYVMSLPISNGIQAAYVVVVVITGAIIGGASIMFTEITEGLGCLLGGFCVSMWLLVLQPGGIVTGAGKIILIATLTIGGFSTSFSHYTKPYALIGLMSFGGATSIMLGIDCFSRAGLKEFWVYLWALNSKIFPLDTASYPLTRGMKVEIGCIFILSLAGIISQLKLWKVIQERREEKAVENFQDNRFIEEEEENIGRQIEINIAKERGQWEEIYGSNDKKSTHVLGRRDSGIADALSTRERRMSNVTSLTCFKDAEIWKAQQKSYATVLLDKDSENHTFTVRVAQETDDHGNPVDQFPRSELKVNPNISELEVDETVSRVDSKARQTELPPNDINTNSTEIETNIASTPAVIPLPFKVPDEIESLGKSRSSVSTFATLGDEENLEDQGRQSSYTSMPSTLQRKMSRRSLVSSKSIGVSGPIEDDRSSLAATIDDLSDDEEIAGKKFSKIDESIDAEEFPNSASQSEQEPDSSIIETISELDVGRCSTPKHLSSHSEINQTFEETASLRSSISASESKLNEIELKKASEDPENQTTSGDLVAQLDPKRIDQENLPRQFSKVFMSYRTNEWAKHLDHAEAPEVEELALSVNSNEVEIMLEEKPAPVNVYELQQTPTSTLSISTTPESSEQQPVSTRMSSMTSNDLFALRITPEKRATHLSQTGFQNNNRSQKSLASSKRKTGFFDQSTPNKAPTQAYLRGFRDRRETLIARRDSIIKRKSMYKGSWGGSALDFGALSTSHAGSSDSGSLLSREEDDEDMPLSQRRNLIRQSSLVSTTSWSGISNAPPVPIIFDSHQPSRRSFAVNQKLQHHQMASWRASLQQDFRAALTPRERIEQQRNIMRMSRRKEEMRRFAEERIKDKREEAWGEKMRSREMLDAHRDAMRRMQQKANRKVT